MALTAEAGLLTGLFRDKVKKMKDPKMEEGTVSIGHPTGFLNFDFINGCILFGKKDNQNVQYYSVGVTDGSMVMVIGRSGCGKTTWIVQVAGNIARQYKTSAIFHDDVENGFTSSSRRSQLTKMLPEELKERYIYRNSGITCENFYERIKAISDLKLANRESFEYDTGMYDSYGERIYKLEPTIYILDSLAMLMPEKYTDEDELSGQMSTTAAAKANASIFRRVVPMLKAANIILFVVNHITEKVEINAFSHSQAQVSYLKQGETLPGGRNPVYLSNNLLRMNDKEKLKPTEGFGIDGSIIEIELIKSRSNKAGQTCRLVYNKETGFDEQLSLFVMLKQYGRVKGAGAFLYFEERPDLKFSQKAFKEKVNENPELEEVFMKECMSVLETIIPKYVENDITENKNTDFTINLLNKMNNLENAA